MNADLRPSNTDFMMSVKESTETSTPGSTPLTSLITSPSQLSLKERFCVSMVVCHPISRPLIRLEPLREKSKFPTKVLSVIWCGLTPRILIPGLSTPEAPAGCLDLRLLRNSLDLMVLTSFAEPISLFRRDINSGSPIKIWWPFGVPLITAIDVEMLLLYCNWMTSWIENGRYSIVFPNLHRASTQETSFLISCEQIEVVGRLSEEASVCLWRKHITWESLYFKNCLRK